jgi:hypothetical protein
MYLTCIAFLTKLRVLQLVRSNARGCVRIFDRPARSVSIGFHLK